MRFILDLSRSHFLLLFCSSSLRKCSSGKISRPGSSNKDAWMGKFTDLSGGERSFVSISLFLALWGATDVPIRIADEFDVFMVSGCFFFSRKE